MKLSIAAIATLLGAVSAAAVPAASAAPTLPKAFTLVAEGGYTLLTNGGTFLNPSITLWLPLIAFQKTSTSAATAPTRISSSVSPSIHPISRTNHLTNAVHSGPNGALSYTQRNAVPTAFQNLFIVEKEVLPLGLTRPHSGALPEGANMTAFGVNERGFLTQGGNDWFAIDGYGENPVKEVYWYGRHSSTYKAAPLWVKECKGC